MNKFIFVVDDNTVRAYNTPRRDDSVMQRHTEIIERYELLVDGDPAYRDGHCLVYTAGQHEVRPTSYAMAKIALAEVESVCLWHQHEDNYGNLTGFYVVFER